jgi:glycosyltransferase 2 family protein
MLVKNKLLTALKIAVSAFSLYIVARSIDISSITNVVGSIDFRFVVLAMMIFWIAQVISSLRCVYIANELGKALSLSSSTKAHFIGLWFNQVLPTSLGGDVIKVAILKRNVELGVAIRVAILDRFSGFYILMSVVVVTLPIYYKVIPIDHSALVDLMAVVSIGFVFSVIGITWASTKLNQRLASFDILSKLLIIISDIWLFHKGRALWRQIWTSLIVHLNGIISFALLGASLGVDSSFITYFLIVPLVFVIALLPISFAGWGVREIGAVWLFGLVGMSSENAAILAIMYGVMLVFLGLPGLVWLMVSKGSGDV